MRPGHFAILILQFGLAAAAVAHGTRGEALKGSCFSPPDGAGLACRPAGGLPKK